jgi:hypothetical protein
MARSRLAMISSTSSPWTIGPFQEGVASRIVEAVWEGLIKVREEDVARHTDVGLF